MARARTHSPAPEPTAAHQHDDRGAPAATSSPGPAHPMLPVSRSCATSAAPGGLSTSTPAAHRSFQSPARTVGRAYAGGRREWHLPVPIALMVRVFTASRGDKCCWIDARGCRDKRQADQLCDAMRTLRDVICEVNMTQSSKLSDETGNSRRHRTCSIYWHGSCLTAHEPQGSRGLLRRRWWGWGTHRLSQRRTDTLSFLCQSSQALTHSPRGTITT